MYNLFISAGSTAWNGEPWQIEQSRCVREYTDNAIIEQFGELDGAAIEALKKLPCIFGYESSNCKAPHFGIIRDVVKRQGQVRVEYEIQPVDPFLTAEDMEKLMFELDIGKWELNRTHWAVKDINLPKELSGRGIQLPAWVQSAPKAVDITTHQFDVALSFPGEVRGLVEQVAHNLEALVGPNAYFYDNNYVAQLARPALDVLLQDIYRNRSKLIVVFVGADYERKDWCGIEFRAIRDIIAAREHNRIMFVRTDDGAVEGVFATDGYVDARRFATDVLARFIQERVQLL
jgi:hypothetical protein